MSEAVTTTRWIVSDSLYGAQTAFDAANIAGLVQTVHDSRKAADSQADLLNARHRHGRRGPERVYAATVDIRPVDGDLEEELCDQLAQAIRDRVLLRLGPNATRLAKEGQSVRMNYSEANEAAMAAMDVVRCLLDPARLSAGDGNLTAAGQGHPH